MNVFAWLLVLALTDATFAGYRAAAGRDARLHKADYYLKAFWMGLAGGVLGALVVAAVTFALLWWQLRSGAAFEHLRGELEAAAARLVFAYAIFATLMLSVMLLWTYPKRQLRELRRDDLGAVHVDQAVLDLRRRALRSLACRTLGAGVVLRGRRRSTLDRSRSQPRPTPRPTRPHASVGCWLR